MKSSLWIRSGLFLLFLAGILVACAQARNGTGPLYVLAIARGEGRYHYVGLGGDIDGMINPVLTAKRGETVTVTLIASGQGTHDIVFVLPDGKEVKSDEVSRRGESTSVTFTAPDQDTVLTYYNSFYADEGTRGVLLVGDVSLEEVGEVSPTQEATPAALPPQSEANLIVQAIQKGGCTACHVIPGVAGAGTIGPDLSAIGQVVKERLEKGEYTGTARTVEEYLLEAIQTPDAFIAPQCPTGPCGKGVMPPTLAQLLASDELTAVVKYLASLPGGEVALVEEGGVSEVEGAAATEMAPLLTEEEFAWAKQTFFERCAGCHGTLRKGATGPALTPDLTRPKGTVGLAAIIFNGTTRGMPDWGKQGILSQEQTEIMAKFLQMEPPEPPEMSLEQMRASWQLLVPPQERPTSPQTQRDWENYFIVTLRDAGQVAVIDGNTYEIVNTVDSGYAVHITRMSASGRYAYVIGRDGRLAMIDLWMEKPEVVARVQTCYDARSVEVSKYEGPEGDFRDKYAITGCYWPPHFVILDGQTLEPLKVVSSRSYTVTDGSYHPEPRVASILASHYKPEWIVNVKETGQIWLVNYSDPLNPAIKMIGAELFLHDGGMDATHRYFLVAANQSNKIAVVDLKESSLMGIVDVGAVPHPGRGANWIDPEFGPVWSTPHLGEASVMSIGTDPEGHPEQAWKVVRSVELPGSGSLFIKTHPKSRWIWVDMVLNSDPVLARTICVIAKSDPSKVYKCWEVGSYGRAVHFEYNKEGTQVWVSLWGAADKPGETGEIVIYDDETLEEIARILNLITPTGKFNVYNTVNDIY